MIRRWLVAMLIALAVAPLAAQYAYKKTAAEVTVGATAINLFTEADVLGSASAPHPTAAFADCSLTGANIRVSYSGVDPTTALGEILVPGNYRVTGADVMVVIKGIRDDSTSAAWNCILVGP
jgi:hypothetical protein